MKALSIALFCCAFAAFTTPGIAAAKPRAKAPAPVQVREIPPAVDTLRPLFLPVLRQDLFDRNNPMNVRSNWPAPPAQPGQF